MKMRLCASLALYLLKNYEEWQAAARYFDMTEFWQWKNDQLSLAAQSNVVAITN